MRPVHLVLEGLRSYRDQAEIDFSRLDLTALIGDTGAGKSSIIEALTVALFNRPTWMGKNVQALRADGAAAMRVVLTFTVGEGESRQTWTVTRIHKANATPSVHKLVCDETSEKVDGERRINDRIEALIGLNYDQFTRAVVIPQGQFAKLLEQTPATRSETLKGIFRLDHLTHIKLHADSLLKTYSGKVSERRGARNALPKNPAGVAAEAEELLARAQRRTAALETAAKEADGHAAAAVESRNRGRELTDAVTRVRRHVLPERLAELGRATATLAEIDAAEKRAAEQRQAHSAQADDERRLAAEALAPFDGRDAAVMAKTALGNAITAAERLAEEHRELTKRKDALDDAQQAAERAELVRQATEARRIAGEAALGDKTCQDLARNAETNFKTLRATASTLRTAAGSVEAALKATRAALDRAVEANALAAVAGNCRPGDGCPVCAQPLPAGFVAPSDPGIDRARQEYEKALRELELAQQQAGAAEERVLEAQQEWERCRENAATSNEKREQTEGEARTAEAKATRAQEDHEAAVLRWTQDAARLAGDRRRVEQELARIPAPYTAACDDHAGLTDALRRLDGALVTAEAHETAAKTAEGLVRQADEDHKKAHGRRDDEVRRPVQEARAEAALLNGALGDIAGLLAVAWTAPTPPDPAAGPAELAGWIESLHGAAGELGRSAEGRIAQHERDAATAMEEITAIASRHGAADLDGLRRALDTAKAEAVLAERERNEAAKAVARAGELDAFLAVGEPFVANLETLSQTLTSGKFIRALVEERERELLFDASKKLRELTGGNFGFGDGFRIVDRRTGQQRPPETLSGGERFLASLALALGLVEIATRGGGQLDALFLDEGFGSLDAGSLDQALSTLGNLAVGGRLVALISHLRRVAEHVDKVLLVERDEVLGSRIRELTPDERDELLAEDARSGLTA